MQWRQRFEAYVFSIPPYYVPALRLALRKFGIPWILPDHIDGSLPYPLANFFKNLKQKNKAEFEKLVLSSKSARVEQQPQAPSSPSVEGSSPLMIPGSPLIYASPDRPEEASPMVQTMQQVSGDCFPRNVFEIPRAKLAQAVTVLREKLFFASSEDGLRHLLPPTFAKRHSNVFHRIKAHGPD